MKTDFIRGIIPALITPMTPTEELDEAGLRRLVDALIGRGVDGIFTLGTAGEFWALSLEEKKQVYAWTVEAADGRVPVYVGTAANSTREAVALAQAAQQAGADCLSVLNPFFITPSEKEMAEHYRAIAASVDLPILMYDLPARTGNPMSTELILDLARSVPTIAGIKDSSGDFSRTLDLIALAPDGFRVIMGRDTLIHTSLMHGAAGAIAASANVVPELGVGIYRSFLAGDQGAASRYQEALGPVRKAFGMGTHPAMLKAGAELMGLPGGPPRSPVKPLSPEDRQRLSEILDSVSLTADAS